MPLHQRLGAGGAREHDLPVLADHLVGRAGHAEERDVDLVLPVAEPRARARADVAALVTVHADVGAFGLQLHRHVVLVAEDVEGARDDAGGASGAQAGRHDLVVEVTPLRLVSGAGHAEAQHSRCAHPSRRLRC